MHRFWHRVKVATRSRDRKGRHEASAHFPITIRAPSPTSSACWRSLDNAKLLAGGQSLMPMLNMRYVLPDHVIDLNRVDGLSYIREQRRARWRSAR